jgi:hypothetical protein
MSDRERNFQFKRYIASTADRYEWWFGFDTEGTFDSLEKAKRWLKKNRDAGRYGGAIFDCDERRVVFYEAPRGLERA